MIILMFSMLLKISADDLLKYFSYFIQKSGFDISWNAKACFLDKNKKNIINLSSAEFAKSGKGYKKHT